MSFISEADKELYIRTIDTVIQAKILLEKRGLYPNELEFYNYTNPYFTSTDEGLDPFLKILELGTGWVTNGETNINNSGNVIQILHIPELSVLFDLMATFTEKQADFFNDTIENMKTFTEDEIGYAEIKLIFGTDGNVALYSEYFSGGLSGFLEKLLDFQDQLKNLLSEVNSQKLKNEVAA
ncbi:hypothetical protein [Bacillus sp. FJAT-29937]|uniref:hypothetical protein n=1 Tax=Bacillus sp. FJAT-29937 TaxID=1720553 RepID=UPI000830678A|nr:hypothetical protein [Bacillus sp. FJAT-29937]